MLFLTSISMPSMMARKSSLSRLKLADGGREARKIVALLAEINRVDIPPPLLKLLQPLSGLAGVVGDIVDRAAERVNLVHRLALPVRHDPHGRIKGAALRAICGNFASSLDFNGFAGHPSPLARLWLMRAAKKGAVQGQCKPH